MDTRKKILEAECARQRAAGIARDGASYVVVTGYFDVLLASHVRRLRELRSDRPAATFIAVLREPGSALLPASARAELVAALDAIDYVVRPEEAEQFLAQVPACSLVREEAADLERLQGLIAHVHRRQKG